MSSRIKPQLFWRVNGALMIEDDIIELQNDRIRALEIVAGVMAKIIDATGNNVLNVLRDVIDGRYRSILRLLISCQVDSGGASRRSLHLARAILDEAPRRLKAAPPAELLDPGWFRRQADSGDRPGQLQDRQQPREACRQVPYKPLGSGHPGDGLWPLGGTAREASARVKRLLAMSFTPIASSTRRMVPKSALASPPSAL